MFDEARQFLAAGCCPTCKRPIAAQPEDFFRVPVGRKEVVIRWSSLVAVEYMDHQFWYLLDDGRRIPGPAKGSVQKFLRGQAADWFLASRNLAVRVSAISRFSRVSATGGMLIHVRGLPAPLMSSRRQGFALRRALAAQ